MFIARTVAMPIDRLQPCRRESASAPIPQYDPFHPGDPSIASSPSARAQFVFRSLVLTTLQPRGALQIALDR